MTDLITVFCGSCGTRGDVASNQVTASLRCRCGSADLGLAGIDDKPQGGLSAEALARVAAPKFDDPGGHHVQRYIDWAMANGHEPEHTETLKAYEKQPGIGRAHTNHIADQLYIGGGDTDWRGPHNRTQAARHSGARTGPTIDDPNGYEYEPAPAHVQRAMQRRFDGGGQTAMDPKNPGHYLHGIGNWWDGPSEVKDNGDGSYTYRNPYNDQTDRFDEHGYYDRAGKHTPWPTHEGSRRTAMPKGPGTGWTGPDPRRFEGWNEYVGPESQSVPRSAPVAMSTTCPTCHGSKYDLIDKGPCRECGGTGTITHPTDRPPVQSYDPNRPMPPGGAGWVGASLQGGLSAVAVAKLGGRPSLDPYGSVDEVLMASSPEYAHRNQTIEQPFDPRNEKSFYPSADTLGPGVRTRHDHPYSHDPGQRPVPGYSPGLGYTENRPYQMDQAACPNCAHAPTELRKDNREDAWWHCPNCGPLANIDRNPQINPYSPPQGFQPDREMKTGGFLPRRKTGRLIAMLVKISQANTGLGASETLDVARATLQRYPEGR